MSGPGGFQNRAFWVYEVWGSGARCPFPFRGGLGVFGPAGFMSV